MFMGFELFSWGSNSFRDTPFRELLLAPHSKRSSASDPVCEANTGHEEWTQWYACN
jgi:hypothetical protein